METKNRKATFKEEQETLKRICAKIKYYIEREQNFREMIIEMGGKIDGN